MFRSLANRVSIAPFSERLRFNADSSNRAFAFQIACLVWGRAAVSQTKEPRVKRAFGAYIATCIRGGPLRTTTHQKRWCQSLFAAGLSLTSRTGLRVRFTGLNVRFTCSERGLLQLLPVAPCNRALQPLGEIIALGHIKILGTSARVRHVIVMHSVAPPNLYYGPRHRFNGQANMHCEDHLAPSSSRSSGSLCLK